jgi:acyl-ACP thioesterase
MVEARIERTYRIRFDEAGESGHLRSSGYLRYAQDVAWTHSEAAGFGRSWYAERRLTWLVRSVELDIADEPEYGAELQVSTEVVGFRRVWARRRSEFTEADSGRLLAVALTDWVLLDGRRRPVRPPDEILELFPTPKGGFTPIRLPVAEDDPAGVERSALAPRLADIDPMGHVNNAVYLDYLEEHLAATGRRGELRRRPRRYRAEFIDSAEQGMTLVAEGWPAELGYDFRLRPATEGRDLFRARLETDASLWVGG